MTRRTATILVGSLVALSGLAGLGAVGSVAGRPKQAEPPREIPVETVVLKEADSLAIRRAYTGVLKAGQESELGFELPGKLTRVLVDEGDRVAAGQVLAELETDQLMARREQLAAERNQALALLAELEAGPRTEQIAAARAEADNLRAQWQLNQLTHQRRDQLRRSGVVSQEEYDQQAFGLQAARARLDAAERRLEELVTGTRQEQIDAQRAVVARLDAAVKQVSLDISDSQLRAPFDGTIAARYLDEGTVAAAGVAVLKILDDTRLEAWIGLPPDEVVGIGPGQRQELAINGRPYAGTVRRILPELDPRTRTRSVVLQLDEPHAELVPGQVVRLAHSVRRGDAGFWLPVAALTRGDRGLWSVLAVVPGQPSGSAVVERRDVELLHSEADRVFVRGTLAAADQVVAGGAHRLVPGQRVAVTNVVSPLHSPSPSLAARR